MANFILIDGAYVNIDQIKIMVYSEEKNRSTFIFNGSEDYFTADGDVVTSVLNKNNDASMHDKLVCQYLVDKLKTQFMTIQTRLDMIARKLRQG